MSSPTKLPMEAVEEEVSHDHLHLSGSSNHPQDDLEATESSTLPSSHTPSSSVGSSGSRNPLSADEDSLNTFTCFPKLPVELQCEVWKAALPKPQIIDLSIDTRYRSIQALLALSKEDLEAVVALEKENEICYDDLDDDEDDQDDEEDEDDEDFDGFKYVTKTPPSSLFRVCKQSREVIMQRYKTRITSGDKKIRVDGVNDTIHIVGASTWELMEDINYQRTKRWSHMIANELTGITNVAVNLEGYVDQKEGISTILTLFPSLKSLTIIRASSYLKPRKRHPIPGAIYRSEFSEVVNSKPHSTDAISPGWYIKWLKICFQEACKETLPESKELPQISFKDIVWVSEFDSYPS